MKKTKVLALVLTILLLVSGCSGKSNNVEDPIVLSSPVNTETPTSGSNQKVVVPDLVNVDENSAKQILLGKGLIPVVEYENSTSIREGNVIRTSPEAGAEIDKDTRVILFVSLGSIVDTETQVTSTTPIEIMTPTIIPTTLAPTEEPTPEPTAMPTLKPTATPTPKPTATPIPKPTSTPTPTHIFESTAEPSTDDSKPSGLIVFNSDDTVIYDLFSGAKNQISDIYYDGDISCWCIDIIGYDFWSDPWVELCFYKLFENEDMDPVSADDCKILQIGLRVNTSDGFQSGSLYYQTSKYGGYSEAQNHLFSYVTTRERQIVNIDFSKANKWTGIVANCRFDIFTSCKENTTVELYYLAFFTDITAAEAFAAKGFEAILGE
jgi:hypothetical protein